LKYRSTSKNKNLIDFKDALFQGLAPDGSLFIPNEIPKYKLKNYYNDFYSIALDIIYPYVKENISQKELKIICKESFNFEVPLKKIEENIYILELFHGPTLAFKDFAARLLARLFSLLNKDKLTILVATSGDTGGAVANGFSGLKGINVVILYPSKRVSEIQELQLTTVKENVKAIEINGSFDDCQKLVKAAFSDIKLRKNIKISSANSINIGRLIPQITYYAWSINQLKSSIKPNFCIPSGNLGNLTGGILAKLGGINIHSFLAATNSNNSLMRFLETGTLTIKPTIKTISNAMDVGNPSNLERINYLYNFDLKKIKNDIKSISINDKLTSKIIKKIKSKYNYILDPHSAVGFASIEKMDFTDKNRPMVIAATAHPAKFKKIIEPIINEEITLPKSIKCLYKKKKRSIKMNSDYNTFKEFLLLNY